MTQPSSNDDFFPPRLLSHLVSPHSYLELRDELAPPHRQTTDSILLRTLTARDIAILTALDQYRYLDRKQIQDLFFHGPRPCQIRLQHLNAQHVVVAWHVRLQPGLHPRPSVYLLSTRGARLLARVSQVDQGPPVRRAEHARTRAYHVTHDLEANAFFVALARASAPVPDQGLYHWVGERGCWRAYQEAHELGPIPDGWGRYLLPEGEIIFFLEWDRGTVPRARLRAKVNHYVSYFRRRRGAANTHVFYAVPTAAREELVRTEINQALRLVGTECCRFWTVTIERLQRDGPLGRIWRGPESAANLISFVDLPTQPRSPLPLPGCIAKRDWWRHRPAGGQGA